LDLKVDNSGELVVTDFDLVKIINGDAIEQDIRTALRTFKGEYFLNTNVGLPYFQEIFKKGTSPLIIQNRFKTAILARPGVKNFESFEIEIDTALRQLNIEFTVNTDAGSIYMQEVI
jgi:hypothetical protein